MPRISLDTNILVYAADGEAGEKNRIARRVVGAAARSEGVLTQQVVGEFLNVSRRMQHLDQQRLRRIAAGLCAIFPLLATSREDLLEAFDRSIRLKLQYWDSVIAGVCLSNGVSYLISEDLQDGGRLDGLTVLNPFNPANEEQVVALTAIADVP
jgi:predicted nucleic acid-binding protein